MEFDNDASTPLFLVDTVVINIKIESVFDTLNISDAAASQVDVEVVIDHLYLADDAEVSKSVQVFASDTLALVSSAVKGPINVSVADHLITWQSATRLTEWPDVEQTLTLVDVAEYDLPKGAFDIVTMTQLVTVTKTKSVSASNTLVVKSNATVYKPDQFWTSYDVVVVNP